MREPVPSEELTEDEPLATSRSANAWRPSAPTPAPPAAIGRFRVLRELGRGAMGVVYEAHDARVDRRVAIKLVALDRVGERGRARVRREARALARLSHPNVVQVFEVGEVDDALFLAMEHVEGPTLRQWQRAAPRGWAEVLAVYRQAGQGLAAAHDKGLIHRDFKPDNALVGADGRVRVIDFGLAREPEHEEAAAREASRSVSDHDTVTQTGAVLGTPAYMAAEQFLGRRLDARTDQFALCVSIYEALYGQRPFEGATRLAIAHEVTRGRMREPPADAAVPAWVLAALRRGLQPDPAARFPDVRALLRALAPPRRRTWWAALGLGAIAAAGVGGWAVAERAPCQDAARQWSAVWSPARREAVDRALGQAPVPYAEHVRARVLGTLDAYGAGWVREHTAACIATRVLGRQSTALMDQRMACLASAQRRFTALVDVLAEADAAVAERAAQAAAELPPAALCADERHVSAQAPPADPAAAARVEALREELDVAIAWHDAGRSAEARERLQSILARAEPLGHRPLLAEARLRLGLAHDAMGEPSEAVQALRAAFFEASAAGLDETAARAATQLVFVEGYRLSRYAQADAWAEHARASLERLHDDAIEPALDMAVANVDVARGRYPAGREGHERAVAGYTARLGPEHPKVAQALANLATAEWHLGDLEAALDHTRRALALQRQALGPQHPEVSRAAFNLGSILLELGRHDEALAQLEISLAVDGTRLGAAHPAVLSTRANIAVVHMERGDYARALQEQREIVALTRAARGEDDVEVASALGNMAVSLVELGEREAAAEALRDALAIVESQLPPDHPDVARALHNLAIVELELGRDEVALSLARRAQEIRVRTLPPEHLDHAASEMLLSTIHEARGELPAAAQAAARALEKRERGAATMPGDLANACMQVARLAWATGGDRAYAYVLAERARDGFLAAGPAWSASHREAVEWLALHPRPR